MSRSLLAVLMALAFGGFVQAQIVIPTPVITHNLWVAVETPSIPGDYRWEFKGGYPSELQARNAVATHCPGCPETTTPMKPNSRTYIIRGVSQCPDNAGDLGINCPSKIPVTVPGGIVPLSFPTPCAPVCKPACERPRLFPLFRRCR